MKIYILQGSTGEYSDRADWIVRAYKDKEQADSDRTKADYEAAEVKNKIDEFESADYYYLISTERRKREESKIRKGLTVDPNCQIDYTGTTYWVKEVELI